MIMDEFIELLKIVAPSIVVLLTTVYLVRQYLRNEEKRRMLQLRAEHQKNFVPLRMQAYERVVLLLERIAPGSLIMRIYKPGMSSRLLQADLVKAIREEYEHNMSQQLYMSHHAWTMVKQAKEETIKMINLAANELKMDSSGNELAQLIFEATATMEKLPTDVALMFVKNEAQKLFPA
jgi:hypothetical protein